MKRWRTVDTHVPPIGKPVLLRAELKTKGTFKGPQEDENANDWEPIPDALTIAKVTHWKPLEDEKTPA
jgi:hypothetical protein